MNIFGLKVIVKSGLEDNILKFHVPLLTSEKKSAQKG